MRKEILFAIIAGALFGAVLAFGIWRANVALKPEEPETVQEEIVSNDEIIDSITELKLTIAKPETYEVITKSPMQLNGATKPESWVVVSAEEEDYIFQPTDSGEFTQEVELTGGVNQIIINAYDGDGNFASQNLLVIYSTEFSK